MKKSLIFIFSLASLFIFASRAISAMPVYTDELPDYYIKKYNNDKNINYKQTLPIYNTDKGVEVKIYSPQNISLRYVTEKYNNTWYSKQNYEIGDNIKFLVAEDVTKNGQVFIKKGTEVTGQIKAAQIGLASLTSPDEIQVSMFVTKDIKGKDVPLYGSIVQEGKDLGIFASLLGIPCLPASIKKNKVFFVYAEK